jgi:hypothetical protein
MDSEINDRTHAFYGISLVPKKYWREYGYMLLTIAGSDGIVSDPELEWLTMSLGRHVKVPLDIIEDWEDFDYDIAELDDIYESLSIKSTASFSKLLIYDAIRMCAADGAYALEEKEQVLEAARIMNMSLDSVIAIEALVDLEQAANKLRRTMF